MIFEFKNFKMVRLLSTYNIISTLDQQLKKFLKNIFKNIYQWNNVFRYTNFLFLNLEYAEEPFLGLFWPFFIPKRIFPRMTPPARQSSVRLTTLVCGKAHCSWFEMKILLYLLTRAWVSTGATGAWHPPKFWTSPPAPADFEVLNTTRSIQL
jgi:hypothetical protein